MAPTSDNLVTPKDEAMTAEQVERFLRDHPRFLAERPGLADAMSPPQRHLGDNVVDLQAFMIDRLRADRRDEKGAQDRLVERARRERSLQDRIHAAALAMIGAVDLDHLVEIVTADLAILLGVDAVALAVETASRDGATHVTCGVRCLPRGTVADLMEDEHEVVLRTPAHADERIFGSAATLVASELIAAQQGLGALIQDAASFFQLDIIYVGIISIGFIALAMDLALRAIARRLLVWQERLA